MNINRLYQIRTATLATVIAIAFASTGAPAFAGETHDNGEGGSGISASPYAVPIEALDGMTLAQYVQQHQAGDPRTATVV